MPNPFNLPEVTTIPGTDEVPVTLAKFKKICEWTNDHNLQCKLGAETDNDGSPIPVYCVGKNHYWLSYGEGQDDAIGPYILISVYDVHEGMEKKVLLKRYRITDSRGNIVQTADMAQKHIRACRLEAERKEAMARKDPKLNEAVNIHMPAIYKPEKALGMVGRI
jgi:hypothetical protein